LRILRDVVGQELKRDEAAEGDVLGLVHDPHSSAAQLFDNPVVGNRLPDHWVSGS
jgi:hypothetical protein